MAFPLPDTRFIPRHALIIGEQMIANSSGIVQAQVYPANGRATCEIQLASADDVERAVQAARAAAPAWRALLGDKRRDLMFRMATVIEEHAQALAAFTVMRLGELFLKAGFPPRVVNVVVGGPETREAMVKHPDIDWVQFVGSSATAKKGLQTASETLKPCGLELGGKSAVIVFADADL
jgi:acyl-CoA reductase-like NAD-dependent aldehyde dehydrogenase